MDPKHCGKLKYRTEQPMKISIFTSKRPGEFTTVPLIASFICLKNFKFGFGQFLLSFCIQIRKSL